MTKNFHLTLHFQPLITKELKLRSFLELKENFQWGYHSIQKWRNPRIQVLGVQLYGLRQFQKPDHLVIAANSYLVSGNFRWFIPKCEKVRYANQWSIHQSAVEETNWNAMVLHQMKLWMFIQILPTCVTAIDSHLSHFFSFSSTIKVLPNKGGDLPLETSLSYVHLTNWLKIIYMLIREACKRNYDWTILETGTISKLYLNLWYQDLRWLLHILSNFNLS